MATAAGPLLGGYLIAAASWRLIFLINVPIGAFVLLLSVRHVPESRDPDARRTLDIAGAVLATLALGGATFALIEGPARGLDGAPVSWPCWSSGPCSGVAFFLVERFSPAPMLPLALFRIRQFTVTNAVTFIVYAALGGALFLLPVQLQVVRRLLAARIGGGPAAPDRDHAGVVVAVGSLGHQDRTPPADERRTGGGRGGPGPARTGHHRFLVLSGVLPAVLVFGFGLGFTVAPLTATALGAVSAEHSGLASAVNNDVARIGGLIAVAVLPALAGISGTSYLHPAELSSGFRSAAFLAGGLCASAGSSPPSVSRTRPDDPRTAPRAGNLRAGRRASTAPSTPLRRRLAPCPGGSVRAERSEEERVMTSQFRRCGSAEADRGRMRCR